MSFKGIIPIEKIKDALKIAEPHSRDFSRELGDI